MMVWKSEIWDENGVSLDLGDYFWEKLKEFQKWEIFSKIWENRNVKRENNYELWVNWENFYKNWANFKKLREFLKWEKIK
jgi:hypothetical protein